MNTEEQITDKDVAAGVNEEPAAQITNSPSTPVEQPDADAQGAQKTDPQPCSVHEDLEISLDDAAGALFCVNEIFEKVRLASTVSDKAGTFEQMRASLLEALKCLDDGIALSQKLDEERCQLDQVAQERRYLNFDAMCAAHGFVKAEAQNNKQSSPDSSPAAEGELDGWRPFDRLLKEEFTANNEVDLDAGHHSDERIWPVYGWVKAFRARQKDNRMPTIHDCRAATEDEMQQQRLLRAKKLQAKRTRGAKKT